mmetsp:Transcript_20394/g.34760  ORF Transcript_20394/g.34760 Transcript_20394/m.34760 type:complete len:391 (-) Transcript_20394:169-1341(-)
MNMFKSARPSSAGTFHVFCGEAACTTELTSKWLGKTLEAGLVEPFLSQYNKSANTKLKPRDFAFTVDGSETDGSKLLSQIIASCTPGEIPQVRLVPSSAEAQRIFGSSTAEAQRNFGEEPSSPATPAARFSLLGLKRGPSGKMPTHLHLHCGNVNAQAQVSSAKTRKPLADLIEAFLKYYGTQTGVQASLQRVAEVQVDGTLADPSEPTSACLGEPNADGAHVIQITLSDDDAPPKINLVRQRSWGSVKSEFTVHVKQVGHASMAATLPKKSFHDSLRKALIEPFLDNYNKSSTQGLRLPNADCLQAATINGVEIDVTEPVSSFRQPHRVEVALVFSPEALAAQPACSNRRSSSSASPSAAPSSVEYSHCRMLVEDDVDADGFDFGALRI